MKPKKQQPLFTKATGSIALRRAAWRARPLTESSLFPFGKPRREDRRMSDITVSELRWYLEQPWIADWPALKSYAETILADERAQSAQFAATKRKPRSPQPGSRPQSNPAAAQKAFADFHTFKETLQ